MTLIENRDPGRGPLLCPHCGGALVIVEIYIINAADPGCTMINILPGDDCGVELGVCDEDDYLTEPGDENRPCVLWLACLKCKRDHCLDIRFEPEGTRVSWRASIAPDQHPGSGVGFGDKA